MEALLVDVSLVTQLDHAFDAKNDRGQPPKGNGLEPRRMSCQSTANAGNHALLPTRLRWRSGERVNATVGRRDCPISHVRR